MTDAPLACLGALALELTPMTLATHLALPPDARCHSALLRR